MIAIEVKYMGPTNSRGSRYKAFTEHQSITLSADYALNADENAAAAACALRDKMKWKGELVEGGTSKGWVFVFIDGNRYK